MHVRTYVVCTYVSNSDTGLLAAVMSSQYFIEINVDVAQIERLVN